MSKKETVVLVPIEDSDFYTALRILKKSDVEVVPLWDGDRKHFMYLVEDLHDGIVRFFGYEKNNKIVMVEIDIYKEKICVYDFNDAWKFYFSEKPKYGADIDGIFKLVSVDFNKERIVSHMLDSLGLHLGMDSHRRINFKEMK